MSAITLDRPWLRFDLGAEHRVLSWAPYNAGFVQARHVLWREVRNADLSRDFDAERWLAEQCDAGNVAMLTSRDIGTYRHETAVSGLSRAECIATVGLSNAERIGTRQSPAGIGTINIALHISDGLSDRGLLEAMSIAAQARTAAVMDHGPHLPQGRATGTGTDCIAVATPGGDRDYAGLHTDTGEAIGRAVYDAVAAGTRHWMATEGAT